MTVIRGLTDPGGSRLLFSASPTQDNSATGQFTQSPNLGLHRPGTGRWGRNEKRRVGRGGGGGGGEEGSREKGKGDDGGGGGAGKQGVK